MTWWKKRLKEIFSLFPIIEIFVRGVIFLIYLFLKFFESLAMPHKDRVIAVNHHYEQDIEAMRLSGNELGIVSLKHNYIFGFANIFFKDQRFRDALIPYDAPEFEEARQRYRKFIMVIVVLLKSFFRHKALILPSDSFFWIREAVHIHREKGIPVIVIDKEGVIAPYYFKEWIPIIKKNYPFISDYLLVWSERQRNFWSQIGVDNSAISVIGQPRSDFFFHPERWMSREKLGLPQTGKIVLFFTYEDDAYVPLKSMGEGKDWGPLRAETHQIIRECAEKNRGTHFIIKCHPQQRDVSKVFKEFKGVKNAVVMTGSQSSNHLIVNSDLVICFQTTAFLDTHLTRKPIIYPAWGELFDELKDEGMLPFHRSKGATICGKPSEFKKALESVAESGFEEIESEKILKARREFVDGWFHSPNGETGRRMMDTVAGIIEGKYIKGLPPSLG
ncbi:MAG: CDP-glycerol glycerophosphotransferase family protein [Nitrospinota bacterium]|nr:CDP-glycerol glycerophosphotransferase family protein [Nitrospinota bacterium]